MDADQEGMVVSIKHKGRPYYHYGILDGRGGCIHVNKRLNKITLDPLEKVLRNASKMDFIMEDEETRRRNLERAYQDVGMDFSYSFLSSNCESWVNKIRYGDSTSTQAESVATYISLLSLLLL